MTFEERIKEMAFEDGCGCFLSNDTKSFKDQYDLLKAAGPGSFAVPDGVEPCCYVENITAYGLLDLIESEISYNENRYQQIVKLARTPEDLYTGKMSLEEIEKGGFKLRSLDELKEMNPGEMIECDILLQSLLHLGYNAGYKNIMSNAAGFSAIFYLDGEIIGTMDSFGMGEHTVRAWKPEML